MTFRIIVQEIAKQILFLFYISLTVLQADILTGQVVFVTDEDTINVI